MTCKKIGGLYHWRIGRVGGSFYLAKPKPRTWAQDTDRTTSQTFAIVALVLAALATIA